MKKLILMLFLPAFSFAGVHVQQGDANLTIGSMTLTGASQGIKFADGTTQTTAGGGSGTSGIISPGTYTWTNNFGVLISTIELGSSSSITGPSGTSAFHGAYASIRSSGTTQGLLIDSRGVPAGGAQQQIGALTVRNDAQSGGPASTLLVLVDSTTDNQTGTGELEIWSLSNTHNDPIIWIHRNSSNSSPEMRWDSPSPNMEMVNTSTNNTVGRGKWEPFAVAAGDIYLQGNSRAWDNTTFENVYYWAPLDLQPSIGKPGIYIRAQDLTNDSGVLASSSTACTNFFTLNNHTVGLCGPNNSTASWGFNIPSTFANAGQVLYQATNSSPFNWEFTTGGFQGQMLTFNSTNIPSWTNKYTGNLNSQALAYTVTSTDTVILASATATSGFTVTLDASNSTNKGQTLTISKVDRSTQPITIIANGTDLIVGTGTLTLNAFMQTDSIMADGNGNWIPWGKGIQITPNYIIGQGPMGTSFNTINTSSSPFCESFYTDIPIVVSTLTVQVNVQSGNMDLGIYDTQGSLRGNAGRTAVPVTGKASLPMTTPTYLPPGQYWMCMVVDNTTATFLSSNYGAVTPAGAAYCAQNLSAPPLQNGLVVSSCSGTRPVFFNYWISIIGGTF